MSARPSAGPRAPTPQQQRLSALVLEGLDTAAIARAMGLAPCTVYHYLYDLYRRVGVHSRAEFMALAIAGKLAI